MSSTGSNGTHLPAENPSESGKRPSSAPRRGVRQATRTVENDLARRYGLLVGIDEVGRGSLAGPVAVGVAVAPDASLPVPDGLTDSKMLTDARRTALLEPIAQWTPAHAIGWASAEEIDRWGIIVALRLAGRRALAELAEKGWVPQVVLLDGSYDWLTTPDDLFADYDTVTYPGEDTWVHPPVVTRVKADLECAVVSAASVVAKVARDRYMEQLEDPGYGWASNKGYSSRVHIEGLRRLGASEWHRRSWSLPGCERA